MQAAQDTGGIIRVRKDRNYSVISNIMVEDERLSWAARGILTYLLSKPNSWQVRTRDLIQRSPAGEDKVRRLLKELETYGYLVRHKTRGAKGRWAWFSEVHEVPQLPDSGGSVNSDTLTPHNTTRQFTACGETRPGKVPDIVSTESVSTEVTESVVPAKADIAPSAGKEGETDTQVSVSDQESTSSLHGYRVGTALTPFKSGGAGAETSGCESKDFDTTFEQLVQEMVGYLPATNCSQCRKQTRIYLQAVPTLTPQQLALYVAQWAKLWPYTKRGSNVREKVKLSDARVREGLSLWLESYETKGKPPAAKSAGGEAKTHFVGTQKARRPASISSIVQSASTRSERS